MARPFFSVCIPNYNHGKYLGEAIESVLAQDCQDFEIVVADNASTDDSVAIVERLAGRPGGDKIRLFRNRKNIGFAPNTERAARPAVGRFQTMLCADDLMLPRALSTYKDVLDRLGDQAERTVLCSTVVAYQGDRRTDRLIPQGHQLTLPRMTDLPPGVSGRAFAGREVFLWSLGNVANVIPFVSSLYPRALYEAVEGYNGTWTTAPDFHFSLKLLAEDPLLIFLDEPLFGYRFHGDSQTGQIYTREAPLRQEFDTYQVCIDYNEKVVGPLGIDHTRMIRNMIEGRYLKESIRFISQGDWMRAFRLFTLSWALYPKQTAGIHWTWALAGLLALGPVGPKVAQAALKLWSRQPAAGGQG